MSEKKKMAKVLRWVNEVRADDGKPPLTRLPHGVLCKPTDCVLGRALEGLVDVRKASLAPDWREIVLPDFINEFRLDFDSGRYPSLVGTPEPLELLEEVTDCFPDLRSGERALIGPPTPRHAPCESGSVGCRQDAPRSPGLRR